MDKLHLLVVSYHFYPSTEIGAKRPSETARYLAKQGYPVTVIRGLRDIDSGDNELALDDTPVNMITVKIPKKRLIRGWIIFKNLWGRVGPGTSPAGLPSSATGQSYSEIPQKINKSWFRRQYLGFESLLMGDKLWTLKCCIQLLIEFTFRRNRYDIIIASGPPPATYAVGLFSSWLFNARFIMDMRDPWNFPGESIRTGVKVGSIFSRTEKWIAKKCLERASALTVASPGIATIAQVRFEVEGTRTNVILNGFDSESLITSDPPTGELMFMYAGSLYYHRNPLPFFEALRAFVSRKHVNREKVHLRMVGDCQDWNGISLISWVKEQQLEDVISFTPAVDRTTLGVITVQSNVLVNFSEGQPCQIPGKSFEYIAANRDLLIFAETDSDVARLHSSAQIGTVIQSNDCENVEAAINTLYSRYVSETSRYESNQERAASFSRDMQLKLFDNILVSLSDH